MPIEFIQTLLPLTQAPALHRPKYLLIDNELKHLHKYSEVYSFVASFSAAPDKLANKAVQNFNDKQESHLLSRTACGDS